MNGQNRGINRMVECGYASVPKDLRSVLRMEIPVRAVIMMIGSVPLQKELIRERFTGRGRGRRIVFGVKHADIDLADQLAVACAAGEFIIRREICTSGLRHDKRRIRLFLLLGIRDQLIGDVCPGLILNVPPDEEFT